ncbi:coiled-coil domain-containing protein 175 [Heterodontus francisci]|uniref:coiled-coil domain-containing protein 175 n=1 Tax=Heterodontus francisci TaxID=7792 RepID=UPI00355BE1DF
MPAVAMVILTAAARGRAYPTATPIRTWTDTEQPLNMKRCPKQLPTVRVALERLQELEKQLKNQKVCFGRETVRHFTQITEGVSQLEEVRRNIHEVLEVETIKASKLRHNLSHLPNKLKQQIAAAVAAARESKATRLKELQDKIKTMTEQIEALEKEYSRLTKENASLCPIQQKAGSRYDDIVSQLNKAMEERTSDQITLNETYDIIRDTQQKIIFVTRDTADLQKEIGEKRKKYESEKEILTVKFTEIHLLVQNQNATNFEKKNKLDELKVKLHELDDNLFSQKQMNKLLEIQSVNLKTEEDSLQTKYNQELKTAEELTDQKQEITDELRTYIEKLRREIEYLRTRSLQTEKETNDAQELNQKLVEKNESRHDALKKSREYETEIRQNLRRLTKRLDTVKGLLAETGERMTELRKQIQEHEENIIAVTEKHNDIMDFLNGELQKYTNKLEKEEQLRETILRKREEISKEIMHVKAATEDYLTHLSMRMKDLKKKRVKLLSEIKRLQQEINMYADKILALRRLLAKEEEAFGNIDQLLSTEVKQLKNEMKDMNETIRQVKEELQDKMSTQQRLESLLAEETAICDELQKERDAQRNEKFELESILIQLKTKTVVLLASKPELKSMLSALRLSLYHRVKNTAEQIKSMEADIYEANRRIEHVEIENCKLKLCNFQLMKAIASLDEEGEKQNAKMKQKDGELQIIYDNLLKSWALDLSVQKEYAACEQSVLNVTEELIKKIHHREQKVGSISNQLEEYLSKMQSFVGSTHTTEETKERCMRKQTKSPQ